MVHEVIFAKDGRNHLELPRREIEVEAILRGRGGARIAGREPSKAELILDEPEDASVLVVDVRHVSLLGIRRNDDHGEAEAQPVVIHVCGRLGIVPAAVVIPKDEDRGVIPVFGLADCIDD